jgi:Bacteriophage Sf6, terminase small subunit-like
MGPGEEDMTDKLSQSKTADKSTRREGKAFRNNPNRSYDPPPMPEMDKEQPSVVENAYKGKLAEKVLQYLQQGKSITQVSEIKGMPSPATIWRWRRDDPEFAEDCQAAVNNWIDDQATQITGWAEDIVQPGVKGYAKGQLINLRCMRVLDVAKLRHRDWRPRVDVEAEHTITDISLGEVKSLNMPGSPDGQGEAARKVGRGKKKLPSRK